MVARLALGISLLAAGAWARAPDAPVRFLAWPELEGAAPTETPQSLTDARKLVDQLRYEEAVVEYQRYLGEPERPAHERALALLELGFVHSVLGDDVTAQQRANQALELDPELKLPDGAPPKEKGFLEDLRGQFASRPRLEALPRPASDPPNRVRAKLTDPKGRVREVLLRHALTANGPYYSTRMDCAGEACAGDIPQPQGSEAYTAWYYVEAIDSARNSIARAASPSQPLELSVIAKDPWYKSPWVWLGSAAAVVGVAAVFYVTSGH